MTQNPPPIRRSSRVNVTCPVRISGQLRSHALFDEDAKLVTLSMYGGKLRTRLPLPVGTKLKVKPLRGNKSAVLRVVWAGRHDSLQAGEVGLECAEGISSFLGISFPDDVGPGKRAC